MEDSLWSGVGGACDRGHGRLLALEWLRAQFKPWFLHLRALGPWQAS